MPRVNTKRKNRGGKHESYDCVRCPDPILPGQQYHEWSFRYGGTYRQHVSHGFPRQSQLTQSKMGEVYAAVEAVEDVIADGEFALEDAQTALDDLVSVVDEKAEEYREASEPFGYQGEHAERADELDSFSSSLGMLSLDEHDPTEDESEWRDRIKGEIEDAIGECP